MSSDDIEPFDWPRRFFGGRRGFFDDIFRGFDEMRRDMEREFEDVEKRIPKDLVREYTTPEGAKVREIGPMVYGALLHKLLSYLSGLVDQATFS